MRKKKALYKLDLVLTITVGLERMMDVNTFKDQKSKYDEFKHLYML